MRQFIDIVESADTLTVRNGLLSDAAGQPIVFYHGTNAHFDTKDIRPSNGSFGRGIYFANEIDNAGSFGKRIIRAHLKMSNPFRTRGRGFDDVFEQGRSEETLQAQGYDGVIYENGEYINGDYLEVLVYSPAQIVPLPDQTSA